MQSFEADVKFLKKHDPNLLVLRNGKAMVAVSPKLQSRVLTSCSSIDSKISHGWINYELIASEQKHPLLNAYGGEDRIWLGPEAGQFGLFFTKNSSFTVQNAKTPAALDREPFVVAKSTISTASFEKSFRVRNFRSFEFDVKLTRSVSCLSLEEFPFLIKETQKSLSFVGFRSDNSVCNIGNDRWNKKQGAVSLWSIGMFPASDKCTAIFPVNNSSRPVNSYFGSLNDSALRRQKGVIYFRGNGKHRSKIGLDPREAGAFLGSIDLERNCLTLIFYTKSDRAAYVNSRWEIQEDPFSGDVLNAYNDGPQENGNALGAFYELESSSPALFLAPNETYTHRHETWHFEGSPDDLIALLHKIEPQIDSSHFFGSIAKS